MNNKNYYLLVAIVLILLGIFFYNKKPSKKQTVTKMPTKVVKSTKRALPKSQFNHNMEDDGNFEDLKQTKEDRVTLIKKRNLEINLPFNSFQLEKDSDKNSLIQFAFKNKATGFKGDLDAIEQSVTNPEIEEYLISLEPFTKGIPNYTKKVSFSDLKNGLTHLFKIKLKENKPEPFALTICKDKSSSNTCLNKKTEDISKIIVDKLGKNEDYIYYYQAVIIHDKKIQMIKSPRINEQNYNDLVKYLVLVGHSNDFAKQTADKIKEFNEKVLSIPVIISGKSLSIELPYQNKNIGRGSKKIKKAESNGK